MSGSPLRKNYVHEIRSIPRYNNSTAKNLNQAEEQSLLQSRKRKNDQFQVLSNCIRSKIYHHSSNHGRHIQKDFFEFILFENGIFGINKVHPSNIKNFEQKKNLTKQCIPQQERLIKSVFFFPTQTIVQCQYNIENKFHKEMILYCPGEFLIINNFLNGKLDKDQFNFNLKDLVLVRTCFSKNTIVTVKDYRLTDEVEYFGRDDIPNGNLKIKLQKYFKDRDFCRMIYRLTQGYIDWLQPIETSSPSSSYFGDISTQTNLPEGFGLLINRKPQKSKSKTFSQKSYKNQFQVTGFEFYFGIFRQGLLDCLGGIWFKDRSSYFGQFQNGNFVGIGQFFSFKSSKRKSNISDCFEYKNDYEFIKGHQFAQWIKQGYFNGTKQLQNKQVINFLQNQYQKLRKIYAIPQKKEQELFQQSVDKIKISDGQNSEQIDDLVEQINQVSFNNNSSTKKQSMNEDITYTKNDDIKNIFKKIRVTNPKIYKNQTNGEKKNIDFDRINSYPIRSIPGQITSRSEDNAINNLGYKRIQTKISYQKKNEILNPTTIKQLDNQESQNQDGWSDKKFDSKQVIDLGFEQVDSNYFRNNEQASSYKNFNQSDFIQKEYAFANPQMFKTPDYFIVENSRSHLKNDPNLVSANLLPEDRVKKNIYKGPSPIKKQKYLSPDQKYTNDKENQIVTIKKVQKILNTGKSRKIFYNQSTKN